jgi:hypothetical protein
MQELSAWNSTVKRWRRSVRPVSLARSPSEIQTPQRTREAAISSALYEEIISGRCSRERKLAVCGGSAGLIASERAELLALLAEENDELVRERAASALLSQPVAALAEALQGDAPAVALFRYCGEHFLETPEIALAIAKHARCPPQLLPQAASKLSPAGVLELMNDLDRLSSRPSLASALLHSGTVTAEQREQLQELLEQDRKSRTPYAEIEVEEGDQQKRVTLLQRLSKMRVVERVQLALKGNREERLLLIRDPCKVVQRAVLQSPRISEREVETFASMANLSEDVLRLIGRNRAFIGNPIIVRNLMNNAKTPLDISLHFLPNCTSQDLKALTLNRNIQETLRSSATRLQRQRAMART